MHDIQNKPTNNRILKAQKDISDTWRTKNYKNLSISIPNKRGKTVMWQHVIKAAIF